MKSDEFIREVDEAVRQDRWLALWKQHGAYIVAAVLAIVLGTAAGVGWREYRESQRLEEARRYAAAEALLRADQPAEAARAFDALAEEAGSGYAVLARLRAAEAMALAGEEGARNELLAALAESDAAPLYRELSLLLVAQRQLDENAATLAERLEPLTAAEQPWRYSALELEALAQMRAGETAAARQTLASLVSDPGAPPDLSRRAAELLAALGGPLQDAAAVEAGPEGSP